MGKFWGKFNFWANGPRNLMLHYEDEIRISRGKVLRKQIEYEIWYNELPLGYRLLSFVKGEMPPKTGEWENKSLLKRIKTHREIKHWSGSY